MSRLRRYPKKFLWGMYVVCLVVSLILDVIWLRSHLLHYHFSFQFFLQFFAIFGLFGCMVLILFAKGLGFFIVVDEDYYDKKSRSEQ